MSFTNFKNEITTSAIKSAVPSNAKVHTGKATLITNSTHSLYITEFDKGEYECILFKGEKHLDTYMCDDDEELKSYIAENFGDK
jgi:predicted nucleic acid-binding protein